MEFIAYAIYSPDKDAYWSWHMGTWITYLMTGALYDARQEVVVSAAHLRLKNYEIHEFVCKKLEKEE